MPDYELGVDPGVLYISGKPGEPWNGLTSITEDPADLNKQSRYIDGVKTLSRQGVESFSGTIEAYTYPDSFYEDILTQKIAQNFGLTYRVMSGEHYKIHLVYNMSISPGETSRKQFESDTFKWRFETLPIVIPGAQISAHLIIDSTKAYPWTIQDFEDVLYGSDSLTSRLPSPQEVLDIFEVNSILRVTDNGDGTATITGPDVAIQMIDATTYTINWPSVIQVGPVSYKISSL
jgi:hypothetical protein